MQPLTIHFIVMYILLSSVYGVLLGTQKGRNIEICNSFELVVNDDRQLDRDYFTAKEEQCKCVRNCVIG